MKKKYKYRKMNKPEYFIERSLASSYEEAKGFSDVYLKNTNLKLKDIIGDEIYSRWRRETCSLSKENIIKKFNNEDEYLTWKKNICNYSLKDKRPSNLAYWTGLGYNVDEAKAKLKERQRSVSKRCVEYWLDKGLSLEDATQMLSDYQDKNSLKKLIKLHGDILGGLYHQEMIELKKLTSKRSIKYWTSLGYSDKEAKSKLKKYQSFFAKKQRRCKEYWLSLGFNLDDSIILAKNYARIKCYFAKEYWVDKGFSEEMAIRIQNKIQREFGYRGIKRCLELNIIPFRSKLEIDFCDYLLDSGLDILTGEVIEYKFPDIIFKNKIIEIFGDYWHANPKFYSENKMIKNKKVSEIWDRDLKRIELFKSLGYDVMIIWEDDLKKMGFDYYKEMILK